MSETDLTKLMNSMQLDIEKIKQQYMEKMQEAMKTIFDSFFTTYPQVKTIYWCQWIPGFNDGDECVFSVGDVIFTQIEWKDIDDPNFDDSLEEGDERIGFNGYDSPHQVDAKMKSDMCAFVNMLHSTLNDAVEATFGTNAWIRAHRDGFEIEDYDCGY